MVAQPMEPIRQKFVVLSINDVYDVFPNDQGKGGLAEFATLLNEQRKQLDEQHIPYIVTLNGDFLSGSEVGDRFQGAHMIDFLNHLQFDYVVLGNHEFDFGKDVLLQRMQETPHCKWLGANVLDTHSREMLPGIVETDVIELPSGLRIGLFGVCTQDTPKMSFPGKEIVFDDYEQVSKTCLEKLKSRDKVDFVIAVTHLSLQEDRTLARKLRDIDLILGGHEHEPFTLYEGKTLIHKSGQNALWLAKMEYELIKKTADPKVPLVVHTQWSMLANQSPLLPEPSTLALIRKYTDVLDAEHEQDEQTVLATLAHPLFTLTSLMRGGPACNAGNLVADAIRSEMKTDFGLVNGGFVRGDKVYDVNTRITVGTLKREMPFPRPTVIVRIQAKYLREAVTQHLSKYPMPAGCFPHISGFRVKYDRTIPHEPKITEFVHENGEPIDLEATFLVATTKFISLGGDGCVAWQKGEVIHVDKKIPMVVADHLKKQQIVDYPEREIRIEIID